MNIEYRDGLLFTSIDITYKNKTLTIDNIVIDTGATHSLIWQDCVDDIGIRVTIEDEIVVSYGIGGKEHAFSKKVDSIRVGEFTLKDCSLDFSAAYYEGINGLLGLDVLKEGNFIIDLKNLTMSLQK